MLFTVKVPVAEPVTPAPVMFIVPAPVTTKEFSLLAPAKTRFSIFTVPVLTVTKLSSFPEVVFANIMLPQVNVPAPTATV